MGACPEDESKKGSGDYMWIVGVLIVILGSVVSNAGVNFQKLSIMKEVKRPKDKQRPYILQPWWVLGLVGVIVGAIADFGGLAFAAQSLLIPLGGVTLVANLYFARLCLGERMTRRDFTATMLIVGGIVAIAVSGSKEGTCYTLTELEGFLQEPGFIAYIVIAAAAGLGLYLFCRRANKIMNTYGAWSPEYAKIRRMHVFALPVLSGVSGAQTIWSAKSIAEMVKTTIQGENQLKYFGFYALLLTMSGTIFGQLHFMAAAMKVAPSLLVVPVFQSVFITVSVIGGGVFFKEMAHMSDASIGVFVLGLLLLLFGIWLLSTRPLPTTAPPSRFYVAAMAIRWAIRTRQAARLTQALKWPNRLHEHSCNCDCHDPEALEAALAAGIKIGPNAGFPLVRSSKPLDTIADVDADEEEDDDSKPGSRAASSRGSRLGSRAASKPASRLGSRGGSKPSSPASASGLNLALASGAATAAGKAAGDDPFAATGMVHGAGVARAPALSATAHLSTTPAFVPVDSQDPLPGAVGASQPAALAAASAGTALASLALGGATVPASSTASARSSVSSSSARAGGSGASSAGSGAGGGAVDKEALSKALQSAALGSPGAYGDEEGSSLLEAGDFELSPGGAGALLEGNEEEEEEEALEFPTVDEAGNPLPPMCPCCFCRTTPVAVVKSSHRAASIRLVAESLSHSLAQLGTAAHLDDGVGGGPSSGGASTAGTSPLLGGGSLGRYPSDGSTGEPSALALPGSAPGGRVSLRLGAGGSVLRAGGGAGGGGAAGGAEWDSTLQDVSQQEEGRKSRSVSLAMASEADSDGSSIPSARRPSRSIALAAGHLIAGGATAAGSLVVGAASALKPDRWQYFDAGNPVVPSYMHMNSPPPKSALSTPRVGPALTHAELDVEPLPDPAAAIVPVLNTIGEGFARLRSRTATGLQLGLHALGLSQSHGSAAGASGVEMGALAGASSAASSVGPARGPARSRAASVATPAATPASSGGAAVAASAATPSASPVLRGTAGAPLLTVAVGGGAGSEGPLSTTSGGGGASGAPSLESPAAVGAAAAGGSSPAVTSASAAGAGIAVDGYDSDRTGVSIGGPGYVSADEVLTRGKGSSLLGGRGVSGGAASVGSARAASMSTRVASSGGLGGGIGPRRPASHSVGTEAEMLSATTAEGFASDTGLLPARPGVSSVVRRGRGATTGADGASLAATMPAGAAGFRARPVSAGRAGPSATAAAAAGGFDPRHSSYAASARIRRARRKELDRLPPPSAVVLGAGIEGLSMLTVAAFKRLLGGDKSGNNAAANAASAGGAGNAPAPAPPSAPSSRRGSVSAPSAAAPAAGAPPARSAPSTQPSSPAVSPATPAVAPPALPADAVAVPMPAQGGAAPAPAAAAAAPAPAAPIA